MATRGRKPKPTAMKELEGNPGKHPLNTSEPKPNKKAPACPKWLEPEAKKEWRRLAKQMEAIGILTEVDMAVTVRHMPDGRRQRSSSPSTAPLSRPRPATGSRCRRCPSHRPI